jgi:hypothetical protein
MDFSKAGTIAAFMVAYLYTAFFAAPVAIGCGFHAPLDAKLESMYPGSFAVAVALRRAADSGVIDSAVLDEPRNVATLFLKTMPRLQDVRKFLARSHSAAELPASFTLGYVETGLWTRFSQDNGEIGIEIHTNGPAEGEAVVLTGEPVVADLLAGRLSVDRALAEGIILIDGNESERSAIRHALLATSEGERIAGSDPRLSTTAGELEK